MKLSLILVFLVTTLDVSPQVANAQAAKPLPIEDVLGATAFGPYSPVQFSRNDKWIVYASQDNHRIRFSSPEEYLRTGVPWNGVGIDISVLDTDSGETLNLTGGKGNNWASKWSPDGSSLAFISDRDGSEHAKLWVWETTTRKLRKVSNANVLATELQWTPDSRSVLLSVPAEINASAQLKEIRSGQPEPEAALYHGATVSVYRSKPKSPKTEATSNSNPWSLEPTRRDLVLVDIGNGKIRSVDRGHRISKYLLSPDGSQIAYSSAKRFEQSGSQQILFDIVVITLSTYTRRVVASDVPLGLDGDPMSWSGDGRYLTFQTVRISKGVMDVYLVDVNTGNLRNLTSFSRPGTSFRQKTPLWGADGKHIYFIRDGALWECGIEKPNPTELAKVSDHQVIQLLSRDGNQLWSPDGGDSTVVVTLDSTGKYSGFRKTDLTNGTSAELLEDGKCHTCVIQNQVVSISHDDKHVVYFSGDAQHEMELWMADAYFQNSRQLTHMNPQFEKFQMGTASVIDWLSLDGNRLQGALLLPAGYEKGKRYPLIVEVYGGDLLSKRSNYFGFGYGGSDNMQLLATRGYVVLLPDAPQRLETPMLDLAKTVLPGVDRLVELGIVDPERIAVMGTSYGGYCTLSLIVQTTRFRAAVMVSGMGDLISAYGQMRKDGTAYMTTITEQGQGLMGGTPWELRDKYIENSPIFFLNRVGTPLLIIHGTADNDVAPSLSDEVFVGLRRLGKEAVYAKYEGEGHSPLYWSYTNQVDLCNRMIAWFDEHLKKLEDKKPEKQ